MSKKQINVVGAVIVKEGKILCAQRSGEGTLPYLWEFPGGKIEKNETKEEALVREINEEMNCTISVGNKITTTTYEYPFGIVQLTTFYCTLENGDPKLLEHEAAEWVEPKELHTYDWAPADIPAIEMIQESMVK
ncbi:MAG TPA: (deoxy)nucleoside triphosphate pyrophosphohydrolase [Bacillota bacterium]|nr:(deoxy)nucleoside triphosphate pyrophosphohydrolase [Bacillota bacterium]